MKAEQSMGLVGAGSVNQSFLSRMPALLAALGPIKASSFRVARRIANTLRAGYAVPDYAALQACRMIWIAVPESALDRVVRDLGAQTPVEGTMIVLCNSERDSLWPASLRAKGAQVASLNAIAESNDRTFVTEGDPNAVSELRRLMTSGPMTSRSITNDKRKLIEMRPGSKAFYFAGINLATQLLLPWIAGAVESLRAAGFSRAEAMSVAQGLAARTLRAYDSGGRKAWNGAAAAQMRQALGAQLRTIREKEPALATLYEEGADLALSFFASD